MRLLPVWLIPDTLPAYRDAESKTAIEQTYKVYQAMQELITEYNSFAESINTKLSDFKAQYDEDIEVFTTSLRQEFQDFIDTIDIKISTMEDTIKDDIKAWVDSDVKPLINNIVNSVIPEINARINDLELSINNANTNIEANTEEITGLKASVGTLQTNFNTLNLRVDPIEENIGDLMTDNESIKKSLEDKADTSYVDEAISTYMSTNYENGNTGSY